MTNDERIAAAIRREVAKAPPPSEELLDLLRRLGCPIFDKQTDRESA